jgi:hypothetical protein
MKNVKFKVGDKVRSLENGVELVIKDYKFLEDDFLYYFIGTGLSLFESSLELISEKISNTGFEIGEKVVCVIPHSYYNLIEGNEYIISDIFEGGGYVVVNDGYWVPSRFKKIEDDKNGKEKGLSYDGLQKENKYLKSQIEILRQDILTCNVLIKNLSKRYHELKKMFLQVESVVLETR